VRLKRKWGDFLVFFFGGCRWAGCRERQWRLCELRGDMIPKWNVSNGFLDEMWWGDDYRSESGEESLNFNFQDPSGLHG
jgi:hypothetical protein